MFHVSAEEFQDGSSLNVGPVLFSCSAFTWTSEQSRLEHHLCC